MIARYAVSQRERRDGGRVDCTFCAGTTVLAKGQSVCQRREVAAEAPKANTPAATQNATVSRCIATSAATVVFRTAAVAATVEDDCWMSNPPVRR
jgi:hypothetical protein